MDSLRHTTPLTSSDVLAVLPGMFWDNDCVMLPGLGGFVCNSRSARYDEDKLEIVPPSRDVLFNARLTTNDGVLANELMRRHGLSYRDALRAVEALVSELQSQLEASESVKLPGLGTLYKEDDGALRFMADAEFERMLRSFGHAAIPLTPLDMPVAMPNPEPLRVVKSSDEPLPWRMKLGRAAAAVAIPLTLAGAYLLSQPTGSDTMLGSNPLWNLSPVAATFVPSEDRAEVDWTMPAEPVETPQEFVERTQWEGPLVFDLERGVPSSKGIRMTIPAPEAPETTESPETVVVPEPVEVKPVTPPEPIRFMIVGGAFSVKDNARRLAAGLTEEGYETSMHVQPNNGLTVVSMGGYANERDAREALQYARSHGHEKAWMKRL